MSVSDGRIDSLDVLRGVAVMGILVANLPAFALPEAAYFSPLAAGGTASADITVWFATYVLVEGKMRGLFALLFGASTLLVVERAEAAGLNGAAIHFRRMGVLFLLGCIHLYGLWWGDILAHYALCGAIAFLFVRWPVRGMLAMAALLACWDAMEGFGLWSAVRQAQPHLSTGDRSFLAGIAGGFGVPPRDDLIREILAYRGTYGQVVRWRLDHASDPLRLLLHLGPETLATMLLGMAGLRSGYLAGRWPRERYRLCAAIGLGLSLPLYLAIGWRSWRGGFALPDVVFGAMAAPVVLRWPAILGYAALVILLMKPAGRLTARIAAVGRVALSNYLGTAAIMTTLFYGYGLGLFGWLSRAELSLFWIPSWFGMLAWSRPWLHRFRHGPAEWLWRSLSSGRAEPMLRQDEPLLQPTRK